MCGNVPACYNLGIMQKYKNAFWSLLFLVLTFVLWDLLLYENQTVLVMSLSAWDFVIAIPLLNIVSIYFAIRSVKLRESSVGTYLGIIGFVAFASYIIYEVIGHLGA
jgi:hypothetical protein